MQVVKSGEGEGEVEERVEEPLHAFQARLDAYANICIQKANKKGVKSNSYKDGSVYQTRKDLIADFLANAKLKKCQNPECGACV